MDTFYTDTFPFDTPRKGQTHAISSIIQGIVSGDKLHHVVMAPTGSGKSAIAVAIQRWFTKYMKLTPDDYRNMATTRAIAVDSVAMAGGLGARSTSGNQNTCPPVRWKSLFATSEANHEHFRHIIATPTKQLQDQYEKEFGGESDIAVFKGGAEIMSEASLVGTMLERMDAALPLMNGELSLRMAASLLDTWVEVKLVLPVKGELSSACGEVVRKKRVARKSVWPERSVALDISEKLTPVVVCAILAVPEARASVCNGYSFRMFSP